jgi:hypothetical protein
MNFYAFRWLNLFSEPSENKKALQDRWQSAKTLPPINRSKSALSGKN